MWQGTDVSDERPHHEEIRAFSSEVSRAASSWIAALARDEAATVWSGLDRRFRVVLVQQWISDNPSCLDTPWVVTATVIA
jgi:hypothetical protein